MREVDSAAGSANTRRRAVAAMSGTGRGVSELAKRMGRGAAGSTFVTWDLHQQLRALWTLRDIRTRPPVLVYQFGKVGSMSIQRALERSGLGRRVVHVHLLSDVGLDLARRDCREAFRTTRQTKDDTGRVAESLAVLHARSRAVNRYLAHRRWTGRVDVITLVRDPIAREVSSYFQNLDRTDPGLARLVRADPESSEVIERSLEAVSRQICGLDPFEWFRDELEAVFGVDVFAQGFDRHRGYDTYRSSDANVLLIRYEDLHRVFDEAVKGFLGLPHVELQRRNVGEDKYYRTTYQAVKEALALPATERSRLYGSSDVRHFYSDDELEAFSRRWS